MKKVLFILFVVLFTTNSVFAEKKVGSYALSYFEKEYDIEASELKNGKFTVYIQVESKSDRRAMISIESNDLENFINALQLMKEKHSEWSKIATENNVTEMTKEMEIKLPKVTVCWSGSKWFFSFRQKLQPQFMILSTGKHATSFVKKVTASSNQYIDETIYWVFSDVADIDGLISALDTKKITSILEKSSKNEDLFK